MTETPEGQGTEPEQPQGEPARQAQVLDAVAFRKRMLVARLKVERFEFEIDDELFAVDAHEISGGERVAFVERARKMHEGKLEGGSQRFYRELIARVFHVAGTKQRIWEGKEVALIDDLPADAHEKLMRKALQVNGMDPDAVKNAKNGSALDA